MDISTWLSLASALLVALFVFRWLRHSKRLKTNKRKPEERRALIVLGSGGHTAEMFKLMDAVRQQCPIRSYIAADEMSKKKALDYEQSYGNPQPEIATITRSRQVGQSFLSSIPTTTLAIFESFRLVLSQRPDVVLCNGPGTCIPICLVAVLLDFLYAINCRVVYVESVCRVESLSLSGKILYFARLCDGFLVQWPELKSRYSRTTYLGRFV